MSVNLNSRRKGFFWALLPVLLPTLISLIALLQISRDDSRYSLHPFKKILLFTTEYYVQTSYGTKESYVPRGELRGSFARKLQPGSWKAGFYGAGALETSLREYVQYFCDKYRTPKVLGCGGMIRYYENPTSLEETDLPNPKTIEYFTKNTKSLS